jgi:hypothetical protein
MGSGLTLKKNQKQPPYNTTLPLRLARGQGSALLFPRSSPSKGEDLKARAFQCLSPSTSKGEGWDGVAFDFKAKHISIFNQF